MDDGSIGQAGERVAARYLARNGYVIVGKNVRMRAGELDIIATVDGTLCFVEVKSQLAVTKEGKRRFAMGGEFRPDQRVNYRKRNKLRVLAAQYICDNVKYSSMPIRFDVVAVYLDIQRGRATIDHSKNIEL